MSQDLAATSGVTEVEERSSSLLSRLLAETFGTFLLTLAIVGVLVYSPLNTVGGLGFALAGAFAYIAAAATVGRVSGAHFNPAISFGAWLGGRMSVRSMFSYWGGQLVGAILAGAVLFATVPPTLVTLLQKENTSDVFDAAVNGFSAHSPLYLQTQGQAQFDWLPALLIEVIISAALVGVYLGANDPRSRIGSGPVAVGSAIAALTLVSWFVTNTGMNPARSTAAALFANNWGGDGSGRQLWLFWVAPLVGAALAALFYRAFGSAVPELEDDLDGDDTDANVYADDENDVDDEKSASTVTATPASADDEKAVKAADDEKSPAEVADEKATKAATPEKKSGDKA